MSERGGVVTFGGGNTGSLLYAPSAPSFKRRSVGEVGTDKAGAEGEVPGIADLGSCKSFRQKPD